MPAGRLTTPALGAVDLVGGGGVSIEGPVIES